MENLSEEGWRRFLKLCQACSSKEQLQELFNLFFTLEEKETLSARCLIIKALTEGRLTQREISETYEVSIAQITRGSNALKIISPHLKKLLETKL